MRSIAEHVVQQAKLAGRRPFGVEGARDGEWVLVDLQDVLVHVMLPRVREFYGLEPLWEAPVAVRKPPAVKPGKAATRGGAAAARPAVRRRGARPVS